MGYSDPGCYGGEVRTPHLDALAAGGLRFTQFYNTARCWPTRAAVMTGYYAQQVRRDVLPGVPSGGGNRGKRPDWAPLLSELLKPHGYRAYHSGKWHIDGRPLENGFDHSYDLLTGQNNFFKARGNTEDGVPVEQTDDFYATTAIADHAIKCLKEHAAKFSDRPFFHYLCFTAPHFPLHALPEDIAVYDDVYTKGWNVIQEERFARIRKMGIFRHALPAMEREVGPPYDFPDAFPILGPGEINRPLPWNELTTGQRQFQAKKMAIHAAMLHRMDLDIGRVVAQLKAMNAFEDTLILFLSDNGASAEIMVRGDGHDPKAPPGSAATYLCLGPGFSSAANTPFRRHKVWTHEGGISTPFIAHWPAGIPARGELRHNPAHCIDVVPTVLELAGVQKPAEIKGQPVPPSPARSLVPAFRQDGTVKHDYLWWLHENNRAFRVGDWKIVASGRDAAWELYDLSQDRGETRNLAARHPDKVRELAGLWEAKTAEFTRLAMTDLPDEPAPKAKAKKTGQKE
jgi:arylsulfatase A-like enzyme